MTAPRAPGPGSLRQPFGLPSWLTPWHPSPALAARRLRAAIPRSSHGRQQMGSSASARVTFSGGTIRLIGFEYAGNYNGLTVVPSSTLVTSAGAEAQCLLKRASTLLGRPEL